VSEDKLREFQTELSHAQADRVAAESKLTAVLSSPPEYPASVLNDPTTTAMQEQVISLRRQMAELETTYKPDYPKVAKLQAQLAPLEAAIQGRLQGITSRLKSEFNEA